MNLLILTQKTNLCKKSRILLSFTQIQQYNCAVCGKKFKFVKRQDKIQQWFLNNHSACYLTENIPHGNIFKIFAYFFTNILLINLCKNVYPHNRKISSEQLTLEWGSKILQGPNSGLADNVPKSRCSSHRESKGPI